LAAVFSVRKTLVALLLLLRPVWFSSLLLLVFALAILVAEVAAVISVTVAAGSQIGRGVAFDTTAIEIDGTGGDDDDDDDDDDDPAATSGGGDTDAPTFALLLLLLLLLLRLLSPAVVVFAQLLLPALR
jgi:hypothetical protein